MSMFDNHALKGSYRISMIRPVLNHGRVSDDVSARLLCCTVSRRTAWADIGQ